MSTEGALPDLRVAQWHLHVPHLNLPFHHQDRRVDSFVVIEGEPKAMLAGSTHTVGPGALVSVPRGVQHTINHRGPGRTRILSLLTPDRGLGRQPAPRI